MKRLSKVLAAAIGFVLGSAALVSAGVVVSETSTATGPLANAVQRRTIYIQGDKQKVDTEGLQTITDLDKRVFYLIDKQKKNYVVMPLHSLGNSSAEGRESATIALERTGQTQVIASNRCDEYRGRQSNPHLRLTVSACVSSSAPGAQEVAQFDRKMVARIAGVDKPAAPKDPAGVVLQKKSVLNVKLPGYRAASIVTKTTVNNITVKRLAEQTFMPPKGYTKIQPQNPNQAPQPDNVQSVMLPNAPTINAPMINTSRAAC